MPVCFVPWGTLLRQVENFSNTVVKSLIRKHFIYSSRKETHLA